MIRVISNPLERYGWIVSTEEYYSSNTREVERMKSKPRVIFSPPVKNPGGRPRRKRNMHQVLHFEASLGAESTVSPLLAREHCLDKVLKCQDIILIGLLQICGLTLRRLLM
jgi:hypothetical protein